MESGLDVHHLVNERIMKMRHIYTTEFNLYTKKNEIMKIGISGKYYTR